MAPVGTLFFGPKTSYPAGMMFSFMVEDMALEDPSGMLVMLMDMVWTTKGSTELTVPTGVQGVLGRVSSPHSLELVL